MRATVLLACKTNTQRYSNWRGLKDRNLSTEQLMYMWAKHEAERINKLLNEHVGYEYEVTYTVEDLPF